MATTTELDTRRAKLFARTSTAALVQSALVLQGTIAARPSDTPDERLALAWTHDELECRGGGVVDDEAFCALLDDGLTYLEALLVTFPALTDEAGR